MCDCSVDFETVRPVQLASYHAARRGQGKEHKKTNHRTSNRPNATQKGSRRKRNAPRKKPERRKQFKARPKEQIPQQETGSTRAPTTRNKTPGRKTPTHDRPRTTPQQRHRARQRPRLPWQRRPVATVPVAQPTPTASPPPPPATGGAAAVPPDAEEAISQLQKALHRKGKRWGPSRRQGSPLPCHC